MTEDELLLALLDTDDPTAAAAFVETATASWADCDWHPVGDRPNNSGTVLANSDPARALVERITNAFDAVIEKAHSEHKGRPECATPREATESWFGVPPEGLHKLSEAKSRGLAQQNVVVRLLSGGGKARRTIEVADYGLGLTGDQMPTTILSLNADNKLKKFYLAGAFGQGGSATFASCELTLIASIQTDMRTRVTFTVVKYMPPEGVKLGSYVYLRRSSLVLATQQIPEAYGDVSTRIKHFGYDLESYSSPLGQRSLYGRAQTILFDPVLPFYLDDRVHDYRRTIKGSRTALNGHREAGDPETKLAHSTPLFFADLGEFGQIGIEYWVLESTGKSSPNQAFVNSAKAVLLTVNGQTHSEWSTTLLRKQAELAHLCSRMIVHVDCNRLSLDAKRALFVSNREESRKGAVQNLIVAELLGVLKADDLLLQLEEAARTAGTKERDDAAEKEIRKEVARMLKLFGFSVAEEAGAKKAGKEKSESGTTGTGGGPRPVVPIPVVEPPTLLEFIGTATTFYPGQRRYVRVRTNANSRHHNAGDPQKSSFNFIADAPIKIAGTTELRNGYLRVVCAAAPEAEIGAVGRIKVELRVPGSETMSAEIAYQMIAQPSPKPAGGSIKIPQINCIPVDGPTSEQWINLGWPQDEVLSIAADYSYSKAKDTLDVYYSTHFPRYLQILKRVSEKSTSLGDSFRRRFEIWITTNVLIHWQDTEADPTRVSDEAIDHDRLDDYRRDELRRLAKSAVMYAQREVLHSHGQSEDGED